MGYETIWNGFTGVCSTENPSVILHQMFSVKQYSGDLLLHFCEVWRLAGDKLKKKKREKEEKSEGKIRNR